jgi:hypothetical protein
MVLWYLKRKTSLGTTLRIVCSALKGLQTDFSVKMTCEVESIVTLECGPLTVKLSSSSLSGCFREKKANFDPKNHFFDIFKFDSLPASVSLCLFLSTVLPRRQK